MTDLFIPMLVGSAAILVFAAINKLTDRHFSPKWHYYMWLTLIIITILPVRIDINLPEKSVNEQQIILQVPEVITQTETTAETPSEITAPQPIKREINISQYLPYIWAAGFAVMLIFRLTGYIILAIRVHKCPEADINCPVKVKKCGFLRSPMLMGVIKPTLILPDIKLTDTQLDGIIAHEMVHYRRGDILMKWLVMFVRCVHWYNPLIHFAAAKCDEYCEISCDIDATKGMDKQSETAYMMTILSLASGKTNPLGAGMSENAKILKRRFAMIKNKNNISRKTRFISLVCAFAMIFTSVFVSGVLAGGDTTSENIKVFLHGKEINLEHKPFVANNTVYLPIREMLSLENIPDEDITYFKGIVQFLTPDDKGGKYVGRVAIGASAGYIGGYSHGSTENIVMAKPVVLSGNTTYVPYDYFNKMRAVGLFEDFYAEVYDENGKIPLITGVGIWNEEKNFSLEMPLALHNDFIIAENEDSVVFSNDKGMLFTIRIKANEGEIVKSDDFIMSENGMTYTIEGGILSEEMVEYVKKSILPIVHYIPLGDTTENTLILYPCESTDYRKIASRPYSESHPAIDLVYNEGTDVVASITGRVIEQGFDSEKGNYIIISNDAAEILYAHLKDVNVKQGDRVNQGDVIGTVGKTGKATGAHLHFEVKINGKHVDPTAVWVIPSK